MDVIQLKQEKLSDPLDIMDDCTETTTVRAPMPNVEKKHSRTWDELVADIEIALSGEEAEIETIKDILTSYVSSPADWKKYAMFDPLKYTRNLVSDGNGKYNLLILAWDVGKSSPIHDHAGAHCFVKMLSGNLEETLYSNPNEEGKPLIEKSLTIVGPNDVTYIDDGIGLHRMANTSHTEPAVSLHIYSPPYKECQVYDERSSSKKPSGCMTFYSRGGVKLC